MANAVLNIFMFLRFNKSGDSHDQNACGNEMVAFYSKINRATNYSEMVNTPVSESNVIFRLKNFANVSRDTTK